MLHFSKLCFLNGWMRILLLELNLVFTALHNLLQVLSECRALYILIQQVCIVVPIL